MRSIKLSLAAITVFMVLVLALTGCGRKGLININGEKVAKDEFYARLERVPLQSMKGGRPVTVPAGQYVIEQMITEKLITQLATKEKVPPTDAQVDEKLKYRIKITGGQFKAQLKASGATEQQWKHEMMLQQAVLNLLTKDVKVSDADLQKAYDTDITKAGSKFVRPEAVRISVIVSKAPDRIQKAYKLLQDGQDFGSVALQLSEDRTTAPYQGVVGWISMNMSIVPMQFRTTAFATSVGKYSAPFFVQDKADKAWVILRTDQKRKKYVVPFPEVKDMIREQIAAQKANKGPFNKALQDFIASSKITVNADRYAQIPAMMKKSASMPAAVQPGASPTGAPAGPAKPATGP